MKITPEFVDQAKGQLSKLKVKIDNIQKKGEPVNKQLLEEQNNLVFIITGGKFEPSPNVEGINGTWQSNCAFFHLQDIPALLICGNWTLENGVFLHPDYSQVYEFRHEGTTYVMNGGGNLKGELEYRQHKAFYLRVIAKKIWEKNYYDAVHSVANQSLTSAQI